jgi:hypothetical protein
MITFNKSTNNYNIPFAVISPKRRSPSKKDGRLYRPDYDPYSNVIGVQQQALFTQDNILDFKKELKTEFADFTIEKIRRERLKKEGYEAEVVKPEVGSSSTKRKVDKSSSEDKRITKHINTYTKLFINTMKSKEVSEVLPDGLYDKGLMVKLSYAIQHAQTKEHLEEADEDFFAEIQNENLQFIPDLSNRNSAVIFDKSTGKFYVAYHGANGIEGVDKQNIKDVIHGNFSKNPEFLESENQLNQLLAYFEDIGIDIGKNVELVGYSLGGSKSLMLAEKYNLKGTHYNAFINPFVRHEIKDVQKEMRKPQTMARIVTDPTTIQSITPPLHAHNREYKHILPLAENKTQLDSHGLDQITKRKPGVDGLVQGKRNIKGEAINHVGNVAGAIFGGYLGFEEGKDNSGQLSEEVYRGILGGAESTLPIVGETDILESGLVGFTHDEIKHSFNWFENLFQKKGDYTEGKRSPSKKEDDTPEGYFKAFEDGVNVDITVDNMIDDIEDGE